VVEHLRRADQRDRRFLGARRADTVGEPAPRFPQGSRHAIPLERLEAAQQQSSEHRVILSRVNAAPGGAAPPP
jgi:hypothetical protein